MQVTLYFCEASWWIENSRLIVTCYPLFCCYMECTYDISKESTQCELAHVLKKGLNLVPTYEFTILSVNFIIFSFVSFLLSCMNYKTITCNKFNSTLLQLLLCLLKISLRDRRSFAQTSPNYPDNNATVLCRCLTVRTPKRLLWQPLQKMLAPCCLSYRCVAPERRKIPLKNTVYGDAEIRPE